MKTKHNYQQCSRDNRSVANNLVGDYKLNKSLFKVKKLKIKNNIQILFSLFLQQLYLLAAKRGELNKLSKALRNINIKYK